MDKKKDYAKKAIAYCQKIKEGLEGLSHMIDFSDDTFNDLDKIRDFKSMFGKVSAWEKDYTAFLEQNKG